MADHIGNRLKLVQAVKEELVGPAPEGKPVDCSVPPRFETAQQSYGPWCQAESGEEILQRDRPAKRYGIGVLYPPEVGMDAVINDQDSGEQLVAPGSAGPPSSVEVLTDSASGEIEDIAGRADRSGGEPDQDDFDLSTANSYRPSSMAVSFLSVFPDGAILVVEATGGRYAPLTVMVEGEERTWWLRKPVTLRSEFAASDMCATGSRTVRPTIAGADGAETLDLGIEVYSRPASSSRRLVTVCLVNRTGIGGGGWTDENCLFQCHFRAEVAAPDGSKCILPYPEPEIVRDDEEESLRLLYRDAQMFAVGHGCSADWDKNSGDQAVSWVSAECLPLVEVQSITPDISRYDGSPIEVAMAPLAGLIPGEDGMGILHEVVRLYEEWIERKKSEINSLDPAYHEAARSNICQCERAAARMLDGIAYLRENPTASRAFQLANHAVLLQQLNSGTKPRKASYDPQAARIIFDEPAQAPDPVTGVAGRGKWRAFQIAFLLASVRSVAEHNVPDRKTVELIWFPTGGGKTEAYLGLSAFSIFLRRLRDTSDSGVQTLMRYTLRLLTAQQFQRASGLVCAMEHLRRMHPHELGEREFSIGIWLGGSTTPNTRQDALADLRALQRGDNFAENKFVLTRCPWCRAQIGPIEHSNKVHKSTPRVVGYVQKNSTVALACSDNQCEFSTGLPVYVIDEDIYEKTPCIVIGTVDKFAMLAWRPEARSLFGIGSSGERASSPPGLIIQDELHLISGPLGSMVGEYEPVIDELCTDHRCQPAAVPKIVSSTATIRRYSQQIRALYGRDDVALFPAPGLDAGDSFFARYALNKQGELEPGRMYLGVQAPGLGSVQTAQVRTLSSLLQAACQLPPDARDPWWTLMAFFNSLRELGTALSLFQSDIPDYLRTIRNRTGIDYSLVRRLSDVRELTGRLRSEEVPAAISALEVPYTNEQNRAVDVCLASNIIEVGIDIDRLSLMSVMGQPKTTSQYIQVTGRVGRRWWERPGLVVTIYSPSKPRDKSHYEQFRGYHDRLYAQVEPTSITPFSPPALDRALHAAIVAYVRQTGNCEEVRTPYPFPAELVEAAYSLLLGRVEEVDPEELSDFVELFEKRIRQWKKWKRIKWSSRSVEEDMPLLRDPGAHVSESDSNVSWATPTSMRNVDAECHAQITALYMHEESDQDD